MKLRYVLFLPMMFYGLPVFAQMPPTPVFVTKMVSKPFVDEIEALGTLKANENVDLSSSVTERVVEVNFDSGQRVKQGDVLIKMDAAEEEAKLKEEQSVVDEAQRQVDRLKPLIKRGATSQSTLDEADLELQTAQSRLVAIQSQIDERLITAPFDGKLGLRNISIGAMAQPGTLITTIDDDTIMKLDFSVPEIYLPSLRDGGSIKAIAKAYPDEVFTGKVQSIDSRVDPLSRAVSVRALLDNADHKLRPGMLMRVKLQKSARIALVLPEESLVPRGEKNYVYVVQGYGEQAKVKFQEVELGSRRKGEVEIIDGLNDGDIVVTHGTLRLSDGASVIVKATETNNESLGELLQQSAPGAKLGGE